MWIAKLNEPAIFISAKSKINIDRFKQLIYTKGKDIHAKKYPYNNFLYQMCRLGRYKGKVEEQNGEMEKWRNGKMENWRDGEKENENGGKLRFGESETMRKGYFQHSSIPFLLFSPYTPRP